MRLLVLLGIAFLPVTFYGLEPWADSKLPVKDPEVWLDAAAQAAARNARKLWDPLESTCRHASLSIL